MNHQGWTFGAAAPDRPVRLSEEAISEDDRDANSHAGVQVMSIATPTGPTEAHYIGSPDVSGQELDSILVQMRQEFPEEFLRDQAVKSALEDANSSDAAFLKDLGLFGAEAQSTAAGDKAAQPSSPEKSSGETAASPRRPKAVAGLSPSRKKSGSDSALAPKSAPKKRSKLPIVSRTEAHVGRIDPNNRCRLIWSDGDVWTRKVEGREERVLEAQANVYTEEFFLNGLWQAGELVVAIKGDKIGFFSGEVYDLEQNSDATCTLKMKEKVLCCPKKHILVEMQSDLDDWTCSMCDRSFPAGTTFFDCKKCDFDVCDACHAKELPRVNARRPVVSHVREEAPALRVNPEHGNVNPENSEIPTDRVKEAALAAYRGQEPDKLGGVCANIGVIPRERLNNSPALSLFPGVRDLQKTPKKGPWAPRKLRAQSDLTDIKVSPKATPPHSASPTRSPTRSPSSLAERNTSPSPQMKRRTEGASQELAAKLDKVWMNMVEQDKIRQSSRQNSDSDTSPSDKENGVQQAESVHGASFETEFEQIVSAHFLNPVTVANVVQAARTATHGLYCIPGKLYPVDVSSEAFNRDFHKLLPWELPQSSHRGVTETTVNLDFWLVSRKDLARCSMGEDWPGFVKNHILISYVNEAVSRLHEQIATPEDIDNMMAERTHVPIGPLKLADLIGLDTCLSKLHGLYAKMGNSKYLPAPLLVDYVEAGWLGKKTKRGFYRYE